MVSLGSFIFQCVACFLSHVLIHPSLGFSVGGVNKDVDQRLVQAAALLGTGLRQGPSAALRVGNDLGWE